MTFLLDNLNQLWLPLSALVLILCFIGITFGIIWGRRKAEELDARAEKRAMRMAKELEAQGKSALLGEKREWHQTRVALEQELNTKRSDLEEVEQGLVGAAHPTAADGMILNRASAGLGQRFPCFGI